MLRNDAPGGATPPADTEVFMLQHRILMTAALGLLLSLLLGGCALQDIPASQPQAPAGDMDQLPPEPAPVPPPPGVMVADALGFRVYPGNLIAPCTVFVQSQAAGASYWDFGDPHGAYNQSFGDFAVHTYDQPGAYTIRLTVTDPAGKPQTVEKQLQIIPENRKTLEPVDGTTLQAMVASIRDDTTVLLKRGIVYETDRPLVIARSNIRFGATGEGDAPVIKFRGPDWKSAFELSPGSSNVLIENIRFNLRSKNFAADVYGAQSVIRNCVVEIGGGLVVARGSSNLLVDNCGNYSPTDRGFFYAGGVGRANQNLFIRRSWSLGSKYEHCVRIHNTRNLLVQDCVLDNRTSAQGKQALNLRDGAEFFVVNSKIDGPNVFGPLADQNGGLYDPPGKERNRKLSLLLTGLTVQNCALNGYSILEAGLHDFLFKDCFVTAYSSGSCFGAEKAYGPRNEPTGMFLRVRAFYEGGKLLTGASKGIRMIETEFNSK